MELYELYKTYNPEERHSIVYEKMFQSGAIYIALRPFYIPNDFHLYNTWMNQQIAVGNGGKDNGSLFSEGYFQALLKSSNAQSLCGLVNMEPTFQVDLFTPLYYPENSIDGFELEPDDVIMQIVMSPRVMANQDITASVLALMIEYLSSFPDLKRVFWAVGSDYQYYNYLVKKAKLSRKSLIGTENVVCGYILNKRNP